MKIERLKIADLKPAEKNTRVHSPKQIEELMRSFRMFGQIRPVIIDEDNVIWCGNGFFEAAKTAGETEVDVYRVVGLSVEQKRKLMLADNQIYTLGGTNTEVMDEFLSSMQDFDVPGYDAEMLEQLYGDIEAATNEMQSYGRIENEAVESIAQVVEGRNNVQETHAYVQDDAPAPAHTADDSLPPTISYSNGMVNVPKDKNTRPYIVCPKCGEKIWV